LAIDLCLALAGDEEFLFSVYAGTRVEEMDLVDWNAAQKQAFLHMQFRAQDHFYKENYPGAEYQVILLDGQPVGRLYLHRRSDEIRIMDITLLPEFRGRGIGTALLRNILEEAVKKCLPVTIHVERFNPALHLYERLGFCLAEDKGVYYFMKWSPTGKEQHETIGSIAER
jgi:ribosomal protein S18 acetylase RimI-like enzyme